MSTAGVNAGLILAVISVAYAHRAYLHHPFFYVGIMAAYGWIGDGLVAYKVLQDLGDPLTPAASVLEFCYFVVGVVGFAVLLRRMKRALHDPDPQHRVRPH